MPRCCLLLTVCFIGCLALLSPANDGTAAADGERIEKLIKQLGADKFQDREEASKALDAIGAPALAALRAAEQATDAEVRRRAGELVTAIEGRSRQSLAFAQTVTQAIEVIQEQFVMEVVPGELTASAVRALYQQVNQSLPADLERQLMKAAKLSAKECSGVLFDARLRLGQRVDLDEQQDCHHSIRGLVQRLDPNGDYFEPAAYMAVLVNNLAGIGVLLREEPTSGRIKVFTPVKDGPAYKAGLRGGDTILKIALAEDASGRPFAQPLVVDGQNLTLQEASKTLYGQPGSKVEVTVQRSGAPQPVTFVVVRGRVTQESVHGCKRHDDDRWDYWLDPETRLAYIRLSLFARDTLPDLRAVLDRLDRDGVRGLVLDLRFNPGGLALQAVDISDLFIDDGLIVDVRQRKQGNPYRSDDDGGFLKFPLACLVNGETRGGAEVMAACLQDHNRAVVIGERTAGKSSVQNIIPFRPTSCQFKLTTAVFHRPDGRKLDRLAMPGRDADEWGVTPNPGYRLLLPDREQQVLKEHLERQGVIGPKGAPPQDTGYADRQLQRAVEYLQAVLAKR
ncbi:MAG: PDZ domain-containing protein [Planctomycetia bacterium]|nr:PDZ domain-containing protein [Planctomycetia bacterium]